MHNLFTPIEVVKSRVSSYPPEALLRFQECLYDITKPRIISLADQRKKLWTWLKALSAIQRQQVSTFYSPEFACLLGRLYKDWLINPQPKKYRFYIEQEHYHIQNERSFQNCRPLQQKLFESVLLVSKGQLYQAITFTQALLKDSQQFFNLLDQLREGIAQIIGEFTAQELKTGRASLLAQIQNQSKELGVWVGTLIMRQISLSYRLGTANIENQCKYEKNQQKDYGNIWRQLQINERKLLLNEALTKSPQQIVTGYMFSVKVAQKCLPVVYVQGEKQECIESWLQKEGKQLFVELTYSKLSNSFSIYSMYRMEIILEIQAKLAALNKVTKAKKKKKKAKQSQSPAKALKDKIVSGKQLQKNEVKKIEVASLKSEQVSQIQQFCKDVNKIQQQLSVPQKELSTISIAFNSKLIVHQNQSNVFSSIQKSDQVKNEANTEIKLSNSPKKQSLNHELEILYNKIKQDCRAKYRKIILNRLIYIFEKLGFGCKPYGSYASQLSLPDSDLDISVDSSILNYFQIQKITYRQQIILSMQYLVELLKSYKWIGDFRLLDRAKVPLLTFCADASSYFQIPADEKLKVKLNGKKIDPQKSKVIVDLTIQPYANTPDLLHCGLQSTQSLKTWLKIYPILQKMIILLKVRLRQVKMNKTYEGGIGSYTLSLLCVAYLRNLEQVPELIEETLEGFSTFLKEFLDYRWVIDPEGQVPLVRQSQPNGPILKHPYDAHNLLDKSNRYAQAFEAIISWDELIKQKI